MTDRLAITSVMVEKFGGFSDLTLDFGSSHFVVVFGPNESGKSTIAELISWLLVGPSGSAEASQRYGDSGDSVTGLLRGTVREQQFEATGEFRIGERGAPSDSGLKVGFAGQDPIGVEEWRGHIAGLTRSMFNRTYWMAGINLHNDTEVRAEIGQTGGLAGISVSSVTKELRDKIKSSISTTAEGTRSFTKLNVEIKAKDAEIRDILSNAAEYTDDKEAIQKLEQDSSALGTRLKELNGEIEARTALDHWTGEVDTRRERFLAACRDAGTDEAGGRLVNVPPADLAAISRIGPQLATAVETLRRVDEELASAESDCETANENLATCSATAKHLGVNLESISLGDTPSTALDTSIALWKQAELDAESKATEKTALDDKVREHENHVARLREAWEKFGTRVTAQKFLESGPKPPPSQPHAIRVSPLVVAGAVAVVANFALPRVTGGIVAAVALGIGMALTRWWPRKLADADPPSAAEPTGSGETDHPRAAAGAVVKAEQDREGAISRQEAAQGELDQRTQRRNELAETSRSSAQGFDLGDEVGRAAAIVDAVTKAVTARSVHQAALKLKTNKSNLHDKHDQEVTEHKSTLRSMMVECAVPERIEVDDIEDLIESFADLTGTRMELEQAEASLAGAQEEWDLSLGSLSDGEANPDPEELQSQLSDLSISDLSNEQTRCDERRKGVAEEIGRLKEHMEGLARLADFARLEHERGALRGTADERVLEGSAFATALHVLKDAVKEHRLANKDPVLTRADEMVAKVQDRWTGLWTPPGGKPEEISVVDDSDKHVGSEKLSTGMNALLSLSLRLAVADNDAGIRGLRIPIICDDPFVNLDDVRAPLALHLLKEAADSGHQVILLTCKDSTFAAAQDMGAHPVELVR